MTHSRGGNIFARIDSWVESNWAEEPVCVHAESCPAESTENHMRLCELRSAALQGALADDARAVLWERLAVRVRREANTSGERQWALITLWFLTPRLRKGAQSIARRTGAEFADVCSAMLFGALGGMRSVGTEGPLAVERFLLGQAFAAAWRAGRRDPRERPTEEENLLERGLLPGEREGAVPCCVTVRVNSMSAALAQRAHGERLGALAHRMGLMPHVREVRQRRRQRARTGQRRRDALAGQQCFFDHQEFGDDTTP